MLFFPLLVIVDVVYPIDILVRLNPLKDGGESGGYLVLCFEFIRDSSWYSDGINVDLIVKRSLRCIPFHSEMFLQLWQLYLITWYGLSHLGSDHCFLLIILIQTQSLGWTSVSCFVDLS